MTQIIMQNISKENVAKMKTEVFNGNIFVINTPEDANKAAAFLEKQKILGIDTETRPSFKKGKVNKVALLQIANDDMAFIFQLRFTGITEAMKKILEAKNIVKVGLSLNDDIRALKGRKRFKPENFVELQTLVKKIGILDQSLQKIYANLFGLKISKAKQLSNWNAQTLDNGQKKYAALDAVACVRIYRKVNRLIKSSDFILQADISQDTETTTQQQ